MSSLMDKPGRRYWRSLDELADTPEFRDFMAREFPAGATELLSEPTRRSFLKVMGASLALAGVGMTASCRLPQQKVLPFSYRPEGYVPGEPRYYATAMELGGVATGLLVLSNDGRPTKVEGNPAHPYSLGGVSNQHLASVLELYDPDRSQKVLQRPAGGGTASVREAGGFVTFATEHFGLLRASGGAGMRVLSESSGSPSMAAMREQFLTAFPQARWYTYEPLSDDNERGGAQAAFGQPYRTHYNIAEADVILALDSDFLGRHPAHLRYERDWAGRRLPNGKPMVRMYSVEGSLTLTGAAADHRLPLRSAQVPAFLNQLSSALGLGGNAGGSADLAEEAQRFLRAVVSDLLAHRGASLITVGPSQSPEVHAQVHALNGALGNVGTTVTYTQDPEPERDGHLAEISALTAELHRGLVSTLVILGGNPAFTAPSDIDFAGGLGKVEHSIHLSLFDNETSHLCAWHLPRTHYLESWGDARAWDGTISVIQPLIAPLYESWTPLELVSIVTENAPRAAYDIVRETLRGSIGGDFEDGWREALAAGIVPNSQFPTVAATAAAPSAALPTAAAVAEGTLEIELVEDYAVYDGRFANNGWLQELPDPVSKLTWDNALYVGVETAADLGLADRQLVHLSAPGGQEVDAAVMLLPGMVRGQGQLALGYGQRESGQVGRGTGFDSYRLRTTDHPWIVPTRVSKIGRKYKLATVQDHFAIDLVGLRERHLRVSNLVREMTLDEYESDPAFAQHMVHHPPMVQLWQDPVNWGAGRQWGMAIDLNVCTGCSVCITACVSENNIPVVGKDQVSKGREMHWIRVDRYFQGDVHNPNMVNQPVTCQHCETAPCEQVCPVAATVHSEEGLNQMVYNRCIGTRYCSNNCPYKVRKFNYFAFNRKLTPLTSMVNNPEVTVRSRGVMEKCTFCVQRIEKVKIRARNEGRPIVDGEITPACAQACPTQAIVFGDINDKNSRVAQAYDRQLNPRAYAMLEELNTRPRLHYSARIRNANSELAPAQSEPVAAAQGEESH